MVGLARRSMRNECGGAGRTDGRGAAGARGAGLDVAGARPRAHHILNDNARPYAGGMHRGIDIAADRGTEVVAARVGEVTLPARSGRRASWSRSAATTGATSTSYLHLPRCRSRAGTHVAMRARGRRRGNDTDAGPLPRRICTSA